MSKIAKRSPGGVIPTPYGQIEFRNGVASEPGQAAYEVTPGNATAPQIHAFVESGVPVRMVPQLASALGLAPEALALRCGLSRATFHRKLAQPAARLDPLGSDLFARYSTLLTQALDTFFNDPVATRNWLTLPQPGLNSRIPVDYAASNAGYNEVEALLIRIDRGVYV